MRKSLFLSRLIPALLVILIAIPVLSVNAEQQAMELVVIHDSRDDLYRTPTGAVPYNTDVTLRLAVSADRVDAVNLRIYNTRDDSQTVLPMSVESLTPEGMELWSVTFNTGEEPAVLAYRFLLLQDGQTLYYEDDNTTNTGDAIAWNKGGIGTLMTDRSLDASYHIGVYDPEFYTPEWFRNAVVYQIFPDRFRDGDAANNPETGSDTFYGELDLIFNEPWNSEPVDGRTVTTESGIGYFNSDFHGGDLAGIIEKLDYLESLGVTVIYLNPIFDARSNHRYDTADYKRIDPILGDIDVFRELIAEADARGMRVILDGVFNHMSSDSLYFDRYGRFETDGACESLDSEWRSWFYFIVPDEREPSPCVDDGEGAQFYESWFGFDSIPKINNEIFATRSFFFRGPDSVARTWGAEGIGGWRLDVGGDIDNGRDASNTYWEGFRTVVRIVDPEAVIIGEEWNDATEWLLGDEWDSVMNYRFRRGIIGLVRDSNFVDNDGRIDNVTPEQFEAIVRSVEEDYPPMAYHALMNLLGSHDTSRLLFTVNNDKNLHRLAALTMYTLPGAPTTYYGDEIAIDAPNQNEQDDPYNRAPYPWADTEGDAYPAPDEGMLAFYQTLGEMRQNTPALREGDMITLQADGTVYSFLRVDAENGSVALVVLNNSNSENTVELPATFASGIVPDGLMLSSVFDDSNAVTGESAQIVLPAKTGNVWVYNADGNAFAPPLTPEVVSSSAEAGSVTVTWDAVDGASAYHVYRSPVAVGGFERITENSVNDTAFVDDSVTNGFVYHYAVASVGADGLVSDLSASTSAVPSDDIDLVFYGRDTEPVELVLQQGANITVTAGIVINDVTGSGEPVPGIRAVASLVPQDAELVVAELNTVPMTYVGTDGPVDLYEATLVPLSAGEYVAAVFFTTDAGNSYTQVEYTEGEALPVIVLQGEDTTPPEAPAQVVVTSASLAGVNLAWAAVNDESLAGYRVYRTVNGESTTLLVEVGAAVTSFDDIAVVQGDTYTYAITAIDEGLNESEPVTTDVVSVERALFSIRMVVNVPEGTPGPMHVAGDFKSESFPLWDPGAPEMELTDIGNDQWEIVLDFPEGVTIDYKFVRGTWDAVEKGTECEEINNRQLTMGLDALGEIGEDGTYIVEHTVAKWRDLDNCP